MRKLVVLGLAFFAFSFASPPTLASRKEITLSSFEGRYRGLYYDFEESRLSSVPTYGEVEVVIEEDDVVVRYQTKEGVNINSFSFSDFKKRETNEAGAFVKFIRGFSKGLFLSFPKNLENRPEVFDAIAPYSTVFFVFPKNHSKREPLLNIYDADTLRISRLFVGRQVRRGVYNRFLQKLQISVPEVVVFRLSYTTFPG